MKRLVLLAASLFGTLGLALAAAAEPASAPAQPEKDWEVELSPYAWTALPRGRIDTNTDLLGTQSFSMQMNDLLEQLDLAAMFLAKLRWQRVVGIVDFAWAKLEDSDGIGQRIRYDISPRIGWLNVLGGYRVYERPGNLFGITEPGDRRKFSIDLLAGVSYSWMRVELDLSRDPLLEVPPEQRHIDQDNDWVGPVLETDLQNDFTDRLRWSNRLAVGGFGAGDAPNFTWQITSTLDYEIFHHVLLKAGFRAISSYDTNLDLTFYGPVVGAGVRF